MNQFEELVRLLVRLLEKKDIMELGGFPDNLMSGAIRMTYDNKYCVFAPSYHVRTGLVTKSLVSDLMFNDKKLLSVGAGPAYLENFFVSCFGVKKENIVLADILFEQKPECFSYHVFDMFEE